VNQPAALAKAFKKLEAIQKEFNSSQSTGTKGRRFSLADLIVLGAAQPSRSCERPGTK